jgi:hypothetical protein
MVALVVEAAAGAVLVVTAMTGQLVSSREHLGQKHQRLQRPQGTRGEKDGDMKLKKEGCEEPEKRNCRLCSLEELSTDMPSGSRVSDMPGLGAMTLAAIKG